MPNKILGRLKTESTQRSFRLLRKLTVLNTLSDVG